jgi:hypothetical protein
MKEFSDYILRNNLEKTFSLTINRGNGETKYREYDSPDHEHTFEIPEEPENNDTVSNWIFKEENGKIIPIVNDAHTKTTRGTHRVFVGPV